MASCAKVGSFALALLAVALGPGADGMARAPQEQLPEPWPTEVSAAARPLRVLWIDAHPSWEWRYGRNALRSAGDIELHTCITDPAQAAALRRHAAAVAAGAPDGAGADAIVELPRTREAFLAYDVILLVDTSALRPRELVADQADWMLHVMKALDAGRGVGFVCGSPHALECYRGTVLEPLLPVALPPPDVAPREPMPAAVAPPATPFHLIARRSSDADADGRRWAGRLAPVTLRLPPLALRNGAVTVLAAGTEPVVVAGAWSKGRTLFAGTDASWSWRPRLGDAAHATYWRNVVHWLAARD